MNITDLIGGGVGSVVSSTIAKTLGIEESKAKWIVSAAVPLMIAALNYNAKNKGQAENIDNALDQHSGGGILDNLGGLFSGGNASDDGNKIVGHIFGNNTGYVTDNLSEKTGLSSGQIGNVLSVLAPVVMGYLGQQKQQSGGGFGDLIGGLLGGGQQSSSAGDLIGGLLGGGKQGGGAGDLIGGLLGNVLGGGQQQQEEAPSAGGGMGMLADLAGEFFKQKSNPSQGGNVLDSLAGLFGK